MQTKTRFTDAAGEPVTAKKYLSKMLELAFDPYNGRKMDIVNTLPKEMSIKQDGKIKTIKRELLLTEAIEPYLVQTAVAGTVAEGADLAKCWFSILPIFNIKGNAYNHAYGEAGMYAGVVPEGAEFPNRTQDYGNAAFATKKYGQSPKISKEMVEDGMVDVIANEILFAGKAVQYAAERACNNAILEGTLAGATGEWDTTATAGSQGVKAVIKAMAVNRGFGMNPTACVMTPGLEGYVMLDLAAPNVNQTIVGNGGVANGFLGMQWGVCAIADVAAGTYTWGSGTNDYIYGLVVDPSRCGGIAISRPLTVDEYDDPIHDLRGMSVSMRMDCQPFVSQAATRIVY